MKQTIGHLDGFEKNRYWKMRACAINLLVGGKGALYTFLWAALTLTTVFPLFFIAGYFSKKLKPSTKEKEQGIPYHYFTGIYSGCVYSPFIKAYELDLFGKCDMQSPILEIAVGDGYFSSLLFKSVHKQLDYGADLIYGTIKSATKYDHCNEYLVMDAMQIPFPDNCFGTVVMNNLMHHVPDRAETLKEALRVLKKGGKFIFSENTSGWGNFMWEQVALRKLKLNYFADRLLKIQLKLYAQSLLSDGFFYDKKAEEYGFKVNKKINFVSKTTMRLGSIFEFMNLKFGQPTRKEMLFWLRLFGLKTRLSKYIDNIIRFCIINDKELVQEEGYAFQYFELEKNKKEDSDIQPDGNISYVCPSCKRQLSLKGDYFCNSCDIRYPVVEGIPIFLSYREKIKGFDSYINGKTGVDSEDFIT